MTTQSLPSHTHHAAPTHEPPAALRAAGLVVSPDRRDRARRDRLRSACCAVEAARRADRRGGPAGGERSSCRPTRAERAWRLRRSPTTPARPRCATRSATATSTAASSVRAATASTLLIATGASPTVAQLLTQVGNGIAQHGGVQLKHRGPRPADNRRSARCGLAASALPITLAGLLPAIALVLLLRREVWTRFDGRRGVRRPGRRDHRRAAALRARLDRRELLGRCRRPDARRAGIRAVDVRASARCSAGRAWRLGALIALLLGNPLSGLTSAPELLPSGWGAFGQWLPQGANATLLRSTAFFDGAGATTGDRRADLLGAGGSALIVIAAARNGKGVRAPR